MTRIDFRLPSLGADMESAILTEWLKKPGEAVRRGEAVAVVETAKGLIDVESFHDGTLAQIVIAPGVSVPVGTILAVMDCESAEGASLTPASSAPPPAGPAVASAPAPTVSKTPAAPSAANPPAAATTVETPAGAAVQRRPVSPAARRRAHELGVELTALQQTGTGGVIHIEEVERFAARAAELPAKGAAAAAPELRAAMRATIAAAMTRSKREIPHYYLGQALDFSAARAWLDRYNAQVPVAERLIEAVLLIKAVAMSASRLEGFNGYFREQRFEPSQAVHVGTAIAVRGGGLVAPALLDAQRKDLPTLMREFSDLVTRVRSGHMRSGEFTAATITVTSLGSDGADCLYPIINPPQVAIVGSGAVVQRPWAVDGQVAVRAILELTLAADHRVTDGRAGSRFLRAIADLLATPEKL